MRTFFVVTICLLMLAGCGPKENSAELQASGPSEVTQAAPSKSIDSATVGVVKGKVLFEGVVPEARPIPVKGNPECAILHKGGMIQPEEILSQNGLLQNVFVYIKQGLEGYSFTPPSTPVTISNKQCVYIPHVSGAMTGQDIVFLNEDSTLHNIHAYSKNNKGFNLGLPLVGMKQVKKLSVPEVMVSLKCDVHPWMLGYLGVLSHPYFGVTGADGSFELKDLPPGDYVLEAWHEKLGAQTLNVTLGPQETKEIEFKFNA